MSPSGGKEPGPAPVGDWLDRVVKGLGAPGVDALETIFGDWGSVVGDTLAARTRPVRVTDGRLVVECDEPALVAHIRYLESQLVARLGELLGDGRISSLEIRVSSARRRGR